MFRINQIISILIFSAAATLSQAQSTLPMLTDIDFLEPILVLGPEMEFTILDEPPRELNGVMCPVYKNTPVGESHPIRFGGEGRFKGEPQWKMSQWDSRANLFPGQGDFYQDGVYRWENYYKVLQVGKRGSGYRTVTIGINGSREYQGEWGKKLDPCFETPHPSLLLAQKTTELGTDIPFKELKKINLKFGGKITKENITAKRKAEWDKNKYTAHVKIHVNIQYLRPDKNKDLGHGQSFGLSINLFDVRNRNQDYAAGDWVHKPQRRYMYNPSIEEIAGAGAREKFHNHEWVNFDTDILPIIKKAFSRAVDFGQKDEYVDPIIQKDLGEYIISSINFGWEVSSLHDVEIQVSDFNLVGTPK